MKQSRFSLIILLLILILIPSDSQSQFATAKLSIQVSSKVPDAYKNIYNELATDLEAFHQTLEWNGSIGETTFAADLMVANGNRGEALLDPPTLLTVELYLERIKEMGIRAATVDIPFPLLDPYSPRSDEYLAFFKEVADIVRGKGMVLFVETSPVFSGTVFSNFTVDYSTYTIESYFQARRKQAVQIAQEIMPDYLSLGNEPSTELQLTEIKFTIDQYLDFINETLQLIDRSIHLKVGAGAGTWEDMEYFERYATETALDFINIHISPINTYNRDLLMNAIEVVELAKNYGKEVTIGEAWLYKASKSELVEMTAWEDIYRRDSYSFWEPLDIKFMEAIAGIASVYDVNYVSLFWSQFLFATLPYHHWMEYLSYRELTRLANWTAWQNIESGEFSQLGRSWKQIISKTSVDN